MKTHRTLAAAAIALDARQPVQDLPYEKLRPRLLNDGQILEKP